MIQLVVVALALHAITVRAAERPYLFAGPRGRMVLVSVQDRHPDKRLAPDDQPWIYDSVTVHAGQGRDLHEAQVVRHEWFGVFRPNVEIDLADGTRLVLTDVGSSPRLKVIGPELLTRWYVEALAAHVGTLNGLDLQDAMLIKVRERVTWQGERFNLVEIGERTFTKHLRLLPAVTVGCRDFL